jgi:hypothetical protein
MLALSVLALVAHPAWAVNYGWGYVYDDQFEYALNESYTPCARCQSNSNGGEITIIRTGEGAYRVLFPNLDGAGGTVLVTPVAFDRLYGEIACKVVT